jgi:transcriptional regulator with XRE-family HTH domain/tetratricopeptide (TPR) repeat protein
MDAGAPAAGEFGPLLLGLRRSAGLSQEELAEASGVSVRALADLERGRSRGPQRRTVQALATALKLADADAERLERAASLGRPRLRPMEHNSLSLPRDLADFTARGPALARLTALAERTGPGRPPVAVVAGQPGLGKTAFAVHAAHILAPHFPDGQFAVDLRGMDPDPTTVRDALARLLRALGVADAAMPRGTDERSGLFRSVVAGRRVLILLDNAVDEDQVRPLLPAAGRTLTIVTSRHALAGLEGVDRLELALLRREESVGLLTRIIGAERVGREAQATRDLVDLCGHLPLAVRIAGQRLAARPQEHIAKLVGQLAHQERRLDTLQAGGLQVRAAFALSYRQLRPDVRVVLRRASLATGPDFSPETAALLADMTVSQASLCADELVDAGLLQPHPSADRYGFHDLLKLFAAEQLAVDDPEGAGEAALDRTAHWMLRRATAAALRFDADQADAAALAGDPDPASGPTDRDQARGWLEAERFQWLAALRHARATGQHRQVIDAAEAMHWFSDLTQHWELWVEVFQCSAGAARALGSKRDEATHLNYLAWARNLCTGDYPAALEAAEAAQAIAHEIDDRLQSGWALSYQSGALHRLGRLDEAITTLREATSCLRTEESAQGRLAELTALNGLGNMLRLSGRAEEALAIHRSSLDICRTGIAGQAPGVVAQYHAVSRYYLGNALAALSRWPEAAAELRYAVAEFEAAGMPAWSAPARLDLGLALVGSFHHAEARTTLLAARGALAELNSPRLPEVDAALRELGELSDDPLRPFELPQDAPRRP